MKDDTIKLIVVAFVLIIAGVAVYKISGNKPQKGYQGQSGGNASGVGGWWSGLWDNAGNIVDAGGRHTSAAVTSLGNAISSVIATSKSDGKAVFSEYGYSDPKPDYGPYILGGCLVIAAGVVAAIVLTKK